MGSERNRQIAQETIKAYQQGYYINAQGRRVSLELGLVGSIYDVEAYPPEELKAIAEDEDEFFATSFTAPVGCGFYLLDADSFEAAEGLVSPLVMNFANAHHPGGGFLHGASAQEESLCRASTLYASLSSETGLAMYEYNNQLRSPVDSDFTLISPNVIVFRDHTGNLLDKPYMVSVGTIPAPDRNGRADSVPDEELENVIRERFRKYLYLAARNGYETLILGAWGCGAFGNDPFTVATIFHDVLIKDRMQEYFGNIVFAILGKGRNYDAFKEVFSEVIQECPPESTAQSVEYPFFELPMRFPTCNHTKGLDFHNIGYTQGIMPDGTPFEAEIWKNQQDTVGVTFVFPDRADYVDQYTPKPSLDEPLVNIAAILNGGMHHSALSLGMTVLEENLPFDRTNAYTCYLEAMGLITFTTPVRNASVSILADLEGKRVVQNIITLNAGERLLVECHLTFKSFEALQK